MWFAKFLPTIFQRLKKTISREKKCIELTKESIIGRRFKSLKIHEYKVMIWKELVSTEKTLTCLEKIFLKVIQFTVYTFSGY